MENVLDASAILALVFEEAGHAAVAEALAAGSGASTANMAEVVSCCARIGMANDIIRHVIELIPISWVEIDVDLAYRAGEMAMATKPFGLSLGDRCCLALAMRERVPAVTADKQWSRVTSLLTVKVKLIR